MKYRAFIIIVQVRNWQYACFLGLYIKVSVIYSRSQVEKKNKGELYILRLMRLCLSMLKVQNPVCTHTGNKLMIDHNIQCKFYHWYHKIVRSQIYACKILQSFVHVASCSPFSPVLKMFIHSLFGRWSSQPITLHLSPHFALWLCVEPLLWSSSVLLHVLFLRKITKFYNNALLFPLDMNCPIWIEHDLTKKASA